MISCEGWQTIKLNKGGWISIPAGQAVMMQVKSASVPPVSLHLTSYRMSKSSKHWSKLCAGCGQRVRLGKLYCVGQLDSSKIWHKECYKTRA